jgi:hypothetical protein
MRILEKGHEEERAASIRVDGCCGYGCGCGCIAFGVVADSGMGLRE